MTVRNDMVRVKRESEINCEGTSQNKKIVFKRNRMH